MNPNDSHRFRIRVEPLDDPAHASLMFEVRHPDDLLAIVERIGAGTGFTADDANALALGIKLLSHVAQAHRHDPLFADIQPAIRILIGNLRSRAAAAAATSKRQRTPQ